MTIFEALTEDHEKQRSLLAMICKTAGDSENRRDLYSQLKDQLQRHAIAEERYFYVPLLMKDLTQKKSRHSVAEHHEIDEYIAALDETDMSSSAWLATAKKLSEHVRHHLKEEETEVFQIAGNVLSQKDKTSLATEYRKLMQKT